VGLANYFVGSELFFSIFYLFPILLAARKAGTQGAVLVSGVSVLVWLWTDLYYSHRVYAYFFTPYWNALVSGAFFLIIVLIYSRWEEEWANARIDKVTRIPNRKAFMESVQLAVRLCQRYSHAISVAYIDIDNFNKINERWGHERGDKALFEIAQGLRSHLRSTDVIGHIGGDEFVIVMPETYPQSSERSLRRIITELSLSKEGAETNTFSVGLATFNKPMLSIDEMLAKADLLMHQAKFEGKNRFVCKEFFASSSPS
jgi:diguanylate cyclase (GGDEF)-like protein